MCYLYFIGEKQLTCVWITHRLEELKYADEATLLVNGQVRLSGNPSRVEQALKAL